MRVGVPGVEGGNMGIMSKEAGFFKNRLDKEFYGC
jgi:hypothetical protein